MPTALRRSTVDHNDPFAGWLPVHHACVKRDHAALQARLRQNPDMLDAITPAGETPMMLLAQGGARSVATITWAMDAFRARAGWQRAQDASGRSVLHHAAHQGSIEVITTLLRTPWDLGLQDAQGNTALHLAASRGWARIVDRLVRAGASTSLCNRAGESSRDVARAMGHAACLEAMPVDRRMDPSSLLFDAVCTLGGDELAITAQVALALDLGALPNDLNDDIPALHHAAHNGHLEATRLLLARGADLHARDDQGNTALTLVVTTLSTTETTRAVAEFLLDRGADVRTQNDQGVSPADLSRLAAQQRPNAWLQAFADRCTRLEMAAARDELGDVIRSATVLSLPSKRAVRSRL